MTAAVAGEAAVGAVGARVTACVRARVVVSATATAGTTGTTPSAAFTATALAAVFTGLW